MSTNDKINDLVNEIWSPDVEETIPHDIDFSLKDRYQFVLKRLCKHSKTFVAKGIQNPYIQIKDQQGKFIFNDRLTITPDNQEKNAIKKKVSYSLDFVFDHNTQNKIYCIMYSYLKKIEFNAGFAELELYKPATLLGINDYGKLSQPIIKQLDAKRKGKKVGDKINVEILVHHYNPKTQHWKMVMPVD